MSQHYDLASLARATRGASPLRNSLLLVAILACLLTAGVWAYLTELDDVTRVDGRIVPSADIQIIEATEPGVLKALHVREGQVVQAGTLLMEFDTTQIDSQLNQEQQRAFGLMARIQRLHSEIEGRDLQFDATLVAGAPDVVQSETALYQGRQAELQAEIDILLRQQQQRHREYEEG